MKTVLKYPLNAGSNVLMIPGGASTIKISSNPGSEGVCLLRTLVDPEQELVEVKVYVSPEGEQLGDKPDTTLEYLDTVQIGGGGIVFHVLLIKEA